MKKAMALSMGDLRNIHRDYMLLLAMSGPLLMIILLRYALPWIKGLLMQELAFNLSHYDLLLLAFFGQLTPLSIGSMTGIILLDERDQQISSYISITPLTSTGYLIYRLAGPITVSFGFNLVLIHFSDLSSLPIWTVVHIVLLQALYAPLVALFLSTFANNKVEGLALSKVSGIFLFVPLIAFFSESGWRFLIGLFPHFWTFQAWLANPTSGFIHWLYVLAGYLMHLLFLVILLRRLHQKTT